MNQKISLSHLVLKNKKNESNLNFKVNTKDCKYKTLASVKKMTEEVYNDKLKKMIAKTRAMGLYNENEDLFYNQFFYVRDKLSSLGVHCISVSDEVKKKLTYSLISMGY
ncbi:hypothetical protein AB837_00197 [bacterium AB1]|nr:hypothetical protein AB837_00197 [bacterium AB1]